MNPQPIPYEKQIFVCTNDAHGEKASCGDHKGLEIFQALRAIAKERKLHPRIRVAQAKCLGQCAKGCNVMIYSAKGSMADRPLADRPTAEDIWYHGVRLDDVPVLADEHIRSAAAKSTQS